MPSSKAWATTSMSIPSRKWNNTTTVVLLFVPIFSLGLSAVSWLQHGIDLPFLDDWRTYERGTALSLKLSDLFTPSNDTLYPVGMALDALAQRYLGGNSVAYQFVSMVGLLGLLLWLQWRLLSSTLENSLLAASAFSLSVFMLQPGSYWGLQNLAYHQGLPILFILGAIAVILDRSWTVWWGIPTVAMLGLLSGFSYISGAISSFVAAILLLIFALFAVTPYRRALVQGGLSLLAASCVTVAAQLWVILFVQRGNIHDPSARWALPVELDFWAFLAGKAGRSLVLPSTSPVASLLVVVALILVTLGLAVRILLRLRNRTFGLRRGSKVGVVFVTLTASIFAYLALLSAGRANLRPPNIAAPLEVFSFGFLNYYHFFWPTLLWPWVAAAGFSALKELSSSGERYTHAFALVVPLIAIPYAIAFGAFSHQSFFGSHEKWRLATQVRCLQTALNKNEDITCPTLYPGNLTTAFAHGEQIGSSFTRYFARNPAPPPADEAASNLRLPIRLETLRLINIAGTRQKGDAVAYEAMPDPILIADLPPHSLRQCSHVEVAVLMRASQPDSAQMFYLPSGQTEYTAQASVSAPVPGQETGFAWIVLSARSVRGFEAELRLDPVGQKQNFEVKELEVRCRAVRNY